MKSNQITRKIKDLKEGAEHDSAPLALSPWEHTFIKSISKINSNGRKKLSAQQEKVVTELWDKHFDE